MLICVNIKFTRRYVFLSIALWFFFKSYDSFPFGRNKLHASQSVISRAHGLLGADIFLRPQVVYSGNSTLLSKRPPAQAHEKQRLASRRRTKTQALLHKGPF